MARITQALPHLNTAEILEKIRTSENFRRQQKWWIVYNALVAPRAAAEIATHTGTTQRLVHQVISDYNRKGAAAIETPGKGGRCNSYLSQIEEQASPLPTNLRAAGAANRATTRPTRCPFGSHHGKR